MTEKEWSIIRAIFDKEEIDKCQFSKETCPYYCPLSAGCLAELTGDKSGFEKK